MWSRPFSTRKLGLGGRATTQFSYPRLRPAGRMIVHAERTVVRRDPGGPGEGGRPVRLGQIRFDVDGDASDSPAAGTYSQWRGVVSGQRSVETLERRDAPNSRQQNRDGLSRPHDLAQSGAHHRHANHRSAWNCILGMSKDKARKRAAELLKMVNIPEADRRLDDYPHQFSGGMRQRCHDCHGALVFAAAAHRR